MQGLAAARESIVLVKQVPSASATPLPHLTSIATLPPTSGVALPSTPGADLPLTSGAIFPPGGAEVGGDTTKAGKDSVACHFSVPSCAVPRPCFVLLCVLSLCFACCDVPCFAVLCCGARLPFLRLHFWTMAHDGWQCAKNLGFPCM